MFEGFERRVIGTAGADINCVIGGRGPAVLLLHGYPQNLAMWSGVAPMLARQFTVVCADLRGYGDSSKPVSRPDHSNYSFREMAADQVTLMACLGAEQFHVVGHDRGARVAHRMALDSPAQLLSASFLDIVPTYDMYTTTDRAFASTFWLWFFLPLPEPFPERLIGSDPDYFFETCLGRYGGSSMDGFSRDCLEEYRRCWRDPAMIHSSCSDYRAGATIDLEHDRADRTSKVRCPALVVPAAGGLMAQHFDFTEIWRDRCTRLRVEHVPGGHFFPEQRPRETATVLSSFLTEVG